MVIPISDIYGCSLLDGDMNMVLAQRYFADVFMDTFIHAYSFIFVFQNDFILKMTNLSGAMISFNF